MARAQTGAARNGLPKGFIRIRQEECKGCGACVDACPQGQIQITDRINRRGHRYVEQADAGKCTGCSLCYVQCPSSAIAVYRLKRPAKGTPGT
jgi:2-oxoglutarate ferredoxin oxidoreductase subunit delta